VSNLTEEIEIDPRECGRLVYWAIKRYGGIKPALEVAEAVAAWLLASNEAWRERGETTTSLVPHFTTYLRKAAHERHAGDCRVCPSWLVAAVTCSACVYDEYVAKAWEALRIENGDPDWRWGQ